MWNVAEETSNFANTIARALERIGRRCARYVSDWGYYAALVVETGYWTVMGRTRGQTVRMSAVFAQMVAVGVTAIPIVFILSFAVGVMLAIQGVHTLRTFGAESQVVIGIALSVTREFGPLITAIVVAGRTGSSLAARIGTMQVSQEVDALNVMSVNPVRYMVAPVVIAMLIMVPALTFMADVAALTGGAVFTSIELGLAPQAYLERTIEVLALEDLMQGLIKSVVFALIVSVVGVSNGFAVTGGAEGVGRATTRAVVVSISYIVIADMLFTWFLNV
jgi:phospholipid/cholesterol/gamma-HCH transport system permease protein